MNKQSGFRVLVAALSLSGAGLVGVAVSEGYRAETYTPVKGDVPTIGFGDTKGVLPGDRTDPVRALIKLQRNVSQVERQLQTCFAGIPMYQYEWDAYVRLSVNVGAGAVCRSSIQTKLRGADYVSACKTILQFNKFKGRSLAGLTSRRREEFSTCMGV
jgi:lysozyme